MFKLSIQLIKVVKKYFYRTLFHLALKIACPFLTLNSNLNIDFSSVSEENAFLLFRWPRRVSNLIFAKPTQNCRAREGRSSRLHFIIQHETRKGQIVAMSRARIETCWSL